jgi:pyrimidine operon attenuation protein/uracil phosphoribosyltransferase
MLASGKHEFRAALQVLDCLKVIQPVCYISGGSAATSRPGRKGVLMSGDEQRMCDDQETKALIVGMAEEIWNGRRPTTAFHLVGVRTRGVTLAQRLAKELGAYTDDQVLVGAVDITLYRDDLEQSRRWPVLLGTEILFRIDGAEIILVDDVLFTGRTIRAALNAICDLGRPARIRLAVLVDRCHRELPIQPDIVGMHLTTDRRDRVRVRLQPIDPNDEIVRVVAARRPPQPERSPAP